MKRLFVVLVSLFGLFSTLTTLAHGQWVTRDERWPLRGPWMWAVPSELPQLYREFNGIDFGHSHLAETLLHTLNERDVERARVEVLEFIFSAPPVPPDEAIVAPTYSRLLWEVERAFDWAHKFHRTVYDIYASDAMPDKDAAIRKALADFLAQPEAVTTHRLDHHGGLWRFPESKSFRDQFRKFNTQIWVYHWFQAAVYDVQLLGNVERQRELMSRLIEYYHGYLRNPPTQWEFMPLITEVAPAFSKRFPEIAAMFDNLHMLHDNIDDVLSRPDLYPTLQDKRAAILRILPIYLHRNHEPDDHYIAYHADARSAGGHEVMIEHSGPRPPTAREVIEGTAERNDPVKPETDGGHRRHGGM